MSIFFQPLRFQPLRFQHLRPTLGRLFALLLLFTLGCSEQAPEATPDPPPPTAETSPPQALDPDDPTLLARPFTAEEIRDGWPVGLEIRIENITPDGGSLERWRVLEADDESVLIEYATLDPTGEVLDEPRAVRSTWVELRDHASFPAASTTRESVVRETALGELEGWLYTLRDDDAGTVTRMFFVKGMAGAPVDTLVTREDELILAMRQIGRTSPR